MVGLLANAAKRLSAGDPGGDPVVQLQTVFGGGKTHSMLALYHLFGDEKVPGSEKVVRESGLEEMPVANRGGSPRHYRNTLVFLAPDRGRTEALEGTTRRYLAWNSISSEEEQLNLDAHGRRQAKENREKLDGAVDLQIEEAYQWLLYPGEEPGPDGKMVLEWSATKIGTGGTLVERASHILGCRGDLGRGVDLRERWRATCLHARQAPEKAIKGL